MCSYVSGLSSRTPLSRFTVYLKIMIEQWVLLLYCHVHVSGPCLGAPKCDGNLRGHIIQARLCAE